MNIYSGKLLKLTNAFIWLLSIFVLFRLLSRLDVHTGGLLAWECESLDHYQAWLRENSSISSYFYRTLHLDNGILSASHRSFWYGFPVAFLTLTGFNSIFWYRFPAFVAAVAGSFIFVYSLKKIFKSPIPSGALFLFFISTPLVLYYAGYGVSASSVLMLSVLLIFLTYSAGENPSSKKLLFLSSMYSFGLLSYAPIRLLIIGCFLSLCVILLLRKSTLNITQRFFHLAYLTLPFLLFLLFQWGGNSLALLLNAREEHIVYLLGLPPIFLSR